MNGLTKLQMDPIISPVNELHAFTCLGILYEAEREHRTWKPRISVRR